MLRNLYRFLRLSQHPVFQKSGKYGIRYSSTSSTGGFSKNRKIWMALGLPVGVIGAVVIGQQYFFKKPKLAKGKEEDRDSKTKDIQNVLAEDKNKTVKPMFDKRSLQDAISESRDLAQRIKASVNSIIFSDCYHHYKSQ